MKLTIFSAETLPNSKRAGRSSKNQVSFGKKGKISFSKATAAHMGLKKGDKVSLAQDDDNPDKWYFYQDKAGYELLETKFGGLFFCHQELVKTFVDAWDWNADESHTVTLAAAPITIKGDKSGTKYWLLELIGSN